MPRESVGRSIWLALSGVGLFMIGLVVGNGVAWFSLLVAAALTGHLGLGTLVALTVFAPLAVILSVRSSRPLLIGGGLGLSIAVFVMWTIVLAEDSV